MTGIAFFDLDGTLSDDRHRKSLYIPGTYSEYWDHDLMLQDPVFEQGASIVGDLLDEGWVVGVLSARRYEYNYNVTMQWIANNGFIFSEVILRDEEHKDLNPAEFKTKVLSVFADPLSLMVYDKFVLYDNDPEVIKMVHKQLGEEHGVLCSWDVDAESPA